MSEKMKSTLDPGTESHITVRPLYTPADLEASNYDHQVGYPGEYPFTRGVQATMYRGRLWTMRQYAGMGDAEESNKRYKYLLANGTTGLSVAFDLPTQIGMDSDHALAAGEVGKVGVAIDSIEDMERVFAGIELTKISTSMTINATDHRHVFVGKRECAGVEYDFDFGLSHARGGIDGGAGGGVHTGQRHGICGGGDQCRAGCGRVCAALVFFLQCAQQFSERSGEVPRGAENVGADHAGAFQGEESAVVDAALSHADRWIDADGAAAGKQYCADGDSGAGGGFGRDAVVAYELI